MDETNLGLSILKPKTDPEGQFDLATTRVKNSPFAQLYKLLIPRARTPKKYFEYPWIERLPSTNLPEGKGNKTEDWQRDIYVTISRQCAREQYDP